MRKTRMRKSRTRKSRMRKTRKIRGGQINSSDQIKKELMSPPFVFDKNKYLKN